MEDVKKCVRIIVEDVRHIGVDHVGKTDSKMSRVRAFRASWF